MTIAITYRTTNLSLWGTGKGSNLTAAETDENFYNLSQAIQDILDGTDNGVVGIANITQTGSQLTIHLEDGRSLGPYNMPYATVLYRGEWAASTSYAKLDIINVPGYGLYLVKAGHTSDTTFSPTYAPGGTAVYQRMAPSPIGATTTTAASTFTLAAQHAQGALICTEPCVVTVPKNADVAYDIGTEITVQQVPATPGYVRIIGDTGVQVFPPWGKSHRMSYGIFFSIAKLRKMDTDVWVLWGELEDAATDDYATDGTEVG